MPIEDCNGIIYHVCHFCGAKDAGARAWLTGGHCHAIHLGWVEHYPNSHTADYACPACAKKAKAWEPAIAAQEKTKCRAKT